MPPKTGKKTTSPLKTNKSTATVKSLDTKSPNLPLTVQKQELAAVTSLKDKVQVPESQHQMNEIDDGDFLEEEDPEITEERIKKEQQEKKRQHLVELEQVASLVNEKANGNEWWQNVGAITDAEFSRPEIQPIIEKLQSVDVDALSLSEFATLDNVLRAHESTIEKEKYRFNPILNRHANIYPYWWNRMPHHIGSWMGSNLGLISWPVSTKFYEDLLRTVIKTNNVQIMVALGPAFSEFEFVRQLPLYWETLGLLCEDVSQHFLCKAYLVTLPDTHKTLVFHVAEWEDFKSPDVSVIAVLEQLFAIIQVCTTPFNTWTTDTPKQTMIPVLKKLGLQFNCGNALVHCRAGVGRSGVFYMMYQAYSNRLRATNLFHMWVNLRLLRMSTIQTVDLLNFTRRYVFTKSSSFE